jgi:carbamoyltransferase
MIILGIADGRDASAALVVDGSLVAAVAQERIDRTRHSRVFPSGAIDAVLDVAGLRARDVDRVAFGTALSPETLLRARPELRGRVTPRLGDAWRGARAALRASGLYMVEQDIARKLLEPKLKGLGFEHAAVQMVEHDRAHATAAYRCQDRSDALVITLDTPGDGAAVTVSVGRHLQLDRVFLQTSLASVCTFPVRVARALGVEPAELAALAASGHAPADLRAVFDKEIGVQGDGFTTRALVPHPDPIAGRIGAVSPEDAAAAARDAIEAAVRAFVRRWVERTRIGHVVVAGEIFTDPWLCGRLLEEPTVETLSVFPAPGDEGVAIGAALGVAGSAMRRLPSLGLGPRYTETQCYKALSVASLPRRQVDNPDETLAALVLAGRSVARFDGPLELSPGGLANRVVLFRADDPALSARVLASLRRPAWSTIGCAICTEEARDAFVGADRALASARARAVALPTTPGFAQVHPGVVQRDGTALPNLVEAADEPAISRLLHTITARTGQRAVAQLDLRFEAEPIVCSPGDAIRAWRASDLDALLLGPYLVERSDTAG